MQTLSEYNDSSKNNTIFVIIKPGFENYSQRIVEKFKIHGYNIKQMRTKRLLMSEAKRLYYIHKNEKFYYSLCKYMSSGNTIGFLFERKGVRMGGKENIFRDVEEIKDDIRRLYGESDMRNVIHSSDSYEHMKKEASIYF